MRRALSLILVLLLTLGACTALAQAMPRYVLPVDGVAVNRTRAGVDAGQSFTLKAKISPPSRAHEAVLWSSSDPSVATVADGVVVTLAPGTALITARVEDKTATCALTVRRPVIKGIRLNSASVALSPGDTFSLSVAAFNPSYARDQVTWASQNEAVARVDENTGLVTATGIGTTRVRARTSGGKIAYCTVTVSAQVRAKAVALSATSKNLSYNERYQLSATVVPASAIQQDKVIAWRSSNPAIAQVDPATGAVQAGDRPGTAVITATTGNGRTAKCKVTVKYLAVKALTLDKTKLILSAGEQSSLTATLSPANATDGQVTWKSSDEAVATVSGGKVVARQSGSARVTATAGGKTATCQVTVRSIQAMVTITAGGDITIGGDPRLPDPASQSHYEKLFAKYGGNFLGNLSDVFTRANEITVVNLESNLTTSSQYANKAYVFRAQPGYVSVLSKGGVDVVGQANNHMADFGATGAQNTRTAVTGAGLSYVANGITAIRQVNGVKVGFCAFNQTGGNVTGAVQAQVKALKAKCDIVVVSLHWGSEYVYAASSAQRNLGRAAVDAGADLVVGHHSHVVSGVEQYKGKYIAYGLGTLSSAILTPDDMDAILFQQTFKVDVKSGVVESGAVSLIPVSMSVNEGVNDAKPVVLAGSARQRVLNKVKYYSRAFGETVPDKCFS